MNSCVPVILFYHMKHLFSSPSFQAKFLLISFTNLSLIDLSPIFLGYSRILELNNFFFFFFLVTTHGMQNFCDQGSNACTLH